MANEQEMTMVDSLMNDYPFLFGFSIMDNGIWLTDEITPNEKLVYFAITSKTNSESAVAWPSYNTLAKMTGLTKPTVIKSVKRLIEVDLIIKKETAYKSNQYRIKSVQNSKKLGIKESEIVDRLERKMKMSVGQAIEQKDEPPAKAEKADPIPYKEIIEYLNERAGKKFAHTTERDCRSFIRGRWAELKQIGMDDKTILGEFKRVIDIKVSHWVDNPQWVDKLRPSTLFRPSNFDKYRNENPHVKPFMGNSSGQASENRFESFLNSEE